MGLATFLRRALVLSVNVTLRMSLMLITSVFVLFMIFAFLREHPLGFLFAMVLTFFPGLVFLYLSCVRAGLVAIKASGPPDIKKLGLATIKLFRFNIMLNNLTMTLIGLGGSVLFMMIMTPAIWASIKDGFEISDLGDITEVLGRLAQMPLGILLVLTFGLSISNGIIGTSTAAVAASAADKGPNHHTLWGVTRQFFPLFLLSMLVLWLPTLALVLCLGGPLNPLSSFAGLSIVALICTALFLIWAGCAICGGKALAYAQTRTDMAEEWVKERDGMLGDIVPEANLRELRMKRQEASRLKEEEVEVEDHPDEEPDPLPEPTLEKEPSDTLEAPEPELKEIEEVETKDPVEAPAVEEIEQTEEEFRRLVEERIAADREAKRKAAAKAKRQAAAAKKKAASKTKPKSRIKSRVTKTKPKTKSKT